MKKWHFFYGSCIFILCLIMSFLWTSKQQNEQQLAQSRLYYQHLQDKHHRHLVQTQLQKDSLQNFLLLYQYLWQADIQQAEIVFGKISQQNLARNIWQSYHQKQQEQNKQLQNFQNQFAISQKAWKDALGQLQNFQQKQHTWHKQQQVSEQQYDSLTQILNLSQAQVQSLEQQLAQEKNKIPEALSFKIKDKEVKYLGETKDGKANGKGIAFWETGSIYKGNWKDNKRHGFGVFEWKDGERYEGYYQEGKRHGFGVYIWKNGERYEGYWQEDKRNGEGVVWDKHHQIKIKGIWQDDKLNRDLAIEQSN